MNFGEITNLIRENWATIAAATVIVTPILWLILHFLFKHRIELLEAQKDALKQQNDSLDQRIKTLESDMPQGFTRNSPDTNEGTVDMICEWTRIAYEVTSRWQRAMQNKLPWPGDSLALVERENTLYTKILARLDRSDLLQDQLAAELVSFREMSDISHWYKRRESLMSMVGSALQRKK